MKKNAPQGPIRRKLAAIAVAACFAAPGALANPTGANVVRGTAAIHQTGNLLQITNSPNAIINWQSFSIGANEITRFLQQSPSSAVLNRVTTQNPSQILGALQSNGRVFLINPNGILFGAGAQVDVAGLVASTLNLSDQDFLAGRLRFSDGLGKSVVNDGSIATGPGGSVYLIGSGVANNGLIRSPQGEVVLAAGNSVELVSPGTPNLRAEITATDNEARNLGQIISEAGRIGIYAGLINQSGTIRADSAVAEGGRILLKATKSLTLEAGSVTSASGPSGGRISIQSGDTTLVSGTVEATGSEGNGGRIELLGERVGLINAAELDVSGRAGGGTVLVGGDFQGGNPDVQNASRTYVGREVEIRADASQEGDGGKVVVWADGDTRYYGSISARGGASAGDGGSVEVSGKQHLDFHGRVDVAAPNGTGGNVLLDPQDIVLNTTAQPSPPNNAIGTPDVAFATPPDPGTYTIQIADVTGYAELYLQATRDITVSSALTMGAGNTIRFEANNNININAALTTSGTPSTARPSITLTADADASGAGTLTLAVGANLTAQQGGISLSGAAITGAGNLNATGAAGNNGGNISVTATGAVNLTGTITASGGGAGGGTGRNGGTVTITGAGISTAAITANGTAGAAGLAGGAGGTIQLDSSNGMTTGALAASGGAAGAGSASGGAGGTIVVSNTTAGNVTTGTLTARAGAGTGTALSSAGSISATNDAAGASLQTGAIDTRGNNNGAGGAVSLSSQGALQFGAAATIFTSGGAALAGTAGQSGGVVSLTGATVTTTGAITTSGAAGNAANQAGGNAGAITVTANGAINVSAGTLTASGGNAGGGGAVGTGGNAGSIFIANTSTSTGDIATGALAAVSGNAAGGGAAGGAGSVTVSNDNATAGATLATGPINVNGGAKGGGGSVVLDSDSNISVTGTIQASGGGAAAGGTHGGASGGTITLTGVNRTVTGNITASGGTGTGANQAGGNAGTVLLTGTGTLNTAGITVSTGAATGVGAGGTAGSITLSGSAVTSGALTTTGGTNGAGGAVAATSSAGLLSVGVITASGGTASGTSGNAAGTVTLTSADALTATTITASGTAGAAGLAGGAGGTIQLDSSNGMTTGALAASGGAAGAGSASGGAGGTIVVSNTTAGNVTTGALTARAGAGTGTALSSAGSISATNDAAGASLQTGAIDTRGNNNGAGGAVSLSSQGALQFGAAATIFTSGGAALAGTAGQSGGVVSLTGATVTTTGAITTSGAAGNAANQAGGNAGAITVTANGAINVSAGTLTASGGNAGGGNANGGNGGAVTLDADATSTITLANITTTGGNRAGTGTAGAGGSITVADAALLGANTTITATGGSAGLGAGGSVSFSGTLDSSGASRTLAVNTNGATVFGDAVGGTLALTSLTTNATGTTSLGGDVTTTGVQSYGDAVTLTGNATLTGTTPTFSSTVNGGGFDLALNFSGTTTVNGATFTSIRNLATGNGGTTNLTGSITTTGTQTYDDAVTLTGATTLASGNTAIAFNSTVNGGQTLVVNTTGATTFGGNVGSTTALTSVTTNTGGTTSIGGNVTTTGAQAFNDAVTLAGGGTRTFASTANNAIAFNSTVDGGSGLVANTTGATTFAGVVGGLTPLTSLTTNAGGTTAINGGAVTTSGAQSYNDATTLGGATTLRTTAAGGITAAGVVTATAGTLTLDTGSGAATFNNPANNFGTVAITSSGTVSLVDANALTLAGGSVDSIQARSLSGNLTVSAGITAAGAGNSIVLVAAQDFVNSAGAGALNPGPGRWLVYSASPAGSIENGLTGAAGSALPRLYNRTFGANPPASITEPGNHLIYSSQPALAVAPDNKTKAYGTNDPAQTFVALGFVNDDGVLDTAATAGLTGSFGRAVGEGVGTRLTTQGTFTSDAGYSITFDGTRTLTITPAALTGTIASQSKVYGANDPALAGIAVNLAGVVNTSVADWNGNVTAINDTGNVNATLASLTRAAGETVGASPYAITGGTLNALTGSAAGNYSANLSTAGNTLAITPAALTGTIANQSKVYGANDPALAGIAVNLTGLVNNPAIVTWNGNVSVNDTGNVNAALASLTRAAGETVTGSPYAITGGTLNALTGSAAGNYTASLSTAGNTLAITPAALTGTIANQAKIYGADDPALAGIPVILTGLVNNPAIVTWNGNVAIDDSALTSSVTSLARTVGEGVGGYNITAGTLSAPSGNYSAPTFTGTPTLTINAAPLSFALTTPGQTKVYGADDPALGGIAVTLTGLVNNPAIVTWNGTVAVDDSAVTGTLTSLTRAVGETVAASPYAITAGAVTLSASNANYAKSFDATNSPQLAITPAGLSVTANAQSKGYGAADPALTFGVAGLVNATVTDWNGNGTLLNDTVASVFGGTLNRAAGETVTGSPYAITQGTLAANANYNLTTFTGSSLTITPAPLTITADDAMRPVNQPNPPFSAAYSGFQFGETPAALTGTLSFTTPATTGSPAGIYSITPFGQSSTNYVISYLDGALTVSTAIVPPLTSASLPDPVVASLGQLGMSEPYAKSVGCAAGHATIGAPGDCGGGSVVVAISRQPRGGIRFGPNGEISLEPGLKLHIAPTVDMGALRGASLPNPPAVETNSRPGVGLQITPTLTNRP